MTMTQNESLEVGKTFKLASGGPDLTVSEVIPTLVGDGCTVRCLWFDEKTLEAGAFDVSRLGVKCSSKQSK